MINYLRNLWAAFRNRPVYTPITVEKEVQVVRDLSMSTKDIDDALKAFPKQHWKMGVSLEEFAYAEGAARAIEWFKKRIDTRATKLGNNRD